LKKAFCCGTISLRLQEYINDLTILINCPPKVMLLAVNLHEDLIDAEGVTVATMSPLQSSGVKSTKFDTPESNRFAADSYTRSASKSSISR
jgi:hypothetical protein